MSINPLTDISKVYLEQVATPQLDERVRPGNVEKPLDKAAFKKRRRSLAGKEKSAEARSRGHEGREWHNTGRTYSPDEAKSGRAKMSDYYRQQKYQTAEDPDSDNADTYPASKTKNPKKLRKQKAMGESAVPGKPAERLGAVTLIPKAEQEAARQRALAKAKAMREKNLTKEALDPVGKEDADVDNDGKKNTKSDKYLLKRRKAIGKAISTQEAKEVKKWFDDDGDGIGYEEGEVSGKFKKKKKDVKEGFSNWRQDLSEVMDTIEKEENNKEITEKKVKNKIKINPNLGEAVEELGGTLLEMVEIDEVDYIVESVYDELLDEGYEEDDIEEAIEYALTEAKVTFGHDTSSGATEKKKEGLLSAARKKLSGVKKAAKQAVASGARKVAKGALGVARKMEGGDKTPSAARTGTRKASTYRGAGVGTKERVSSGSYKGPEKKKSEPVADPWEGSGTTPPKAKAKTAPKAKAKPAPKPKAAPKPKTTRAKKTSKLDDLLASVRSEEVQIDEKVLTSAETKKKEQLVKSMKKSASDFETRYPGRGKEVMYATATKMAKKIAEQALEMKPEPKQKPLDTAGERQQYSNLRMLQQKKQQLEKQKLNLQKQGRIPLDTAGYEPEGELIDERSRYAKETGKKFTTGRASVEGGKPEIATQNKKIAPAKIGGSRQAPKERGKKPPVAGEPGSGRQDPAHIVALKRAKRARQQPIGSRFD
jgi:hypothetical protein